MTSLPAKTDKKLGLVIDLDTCVGCQACVTNCKEWNTSGHMNALARVNLADVTVKHQGGHAGQHVEELLRLGVQVLDLVYFVAATDMNGQPIAALQLLGPMFFDSRLKMGFQAEVFLHQCAVDL